jgi:DNA polymerase-3 subunit gamma/tau
VKVAAFQQFKRKSNFSIEGTIREKTETKKEDEKQEDFTNKPKANFSAENLNSKWKSYAYRVQKEKRMGMYATLSKRLPVLKPNFELEFTIDSSVQKIDLDNEKPSLLSYLRKELNNYSISLSVVLTKSEDNSMKYLSGRDRFLQMAEKNDSLHQLREKLGLDIEY